jgi:hypothetical protein
VPGRQVSVCPREAEHDRSTRGRGRRRARQPQAGSRPFRGHEELDYTPGNVEEAYADHIHTYRNGSYPGELPAAPPQDDLLARNHVDPGTARKQAFVKLAEYEDASGNPLPSSPVEQLRRDLARLQGHGGDSLQVRLTRAALSAQDLKFTTDRAQGTLEQAIGQIYTNYAAVVQALADTVAAAKQADQSAARGMKGTT